MTNVSRCQKTRSKRRISWNFASQTTTLLPANIRARIHSTLRSGTKSITGYSVTDQRVSYAPVCVYAPMCPCIYVFCARARTRARVCHTCTLTRARLVPYRNSQFARAFTFKFPLFTFRIVVVYSGTTRWRNDCFSQETVVKSTVSCIIIAYKSRLRQKHLDKLYLIITLTYN